MPLNDKDKEDLGALKHAVEKMYGSLSDRQKALFDEMVSGSGMVVEPNWHFPIRNPPPHGHGGGTHLITGGTGGFTVWVGANGKLHVYHPQPDDYRPR